MNLTLKQMQDSGLSLFFSDKEVDKRLQEMLDKQKALLEAPVKQQTFKNFDEVLATGGTAEYRYSAKRYKLSVLTPDDMNIMDNIDNFNEQGVEYNIPPMYKFHVTTALGNKLFVKAKTHLEAQGVVDEIFGKSTYRVSASKI